MRYLVVLAIVLAGSAPARADDTLPVTTIAKVRAKGPRTSRAITKQLRAVGDLLGLCKAQESTVAAKQPIEFTIAADGTIAITAPDPDGDAGTCLGNSLGQMTFSAARAPTTVRFVARFAPGVSRVPGADLDAQLPGHDPQIVVASGSRTLADVRKPIDDWFTGHVRQCYDKQRAKNPKFAGTITVSIEIDAAGHAHTAQINHEGLDFELAEPFGLCVAGSDDSFAFGAASGAALISVTYDLRPPAR